MNKTTHTQRPYAIIYCRVSSQKQSQEGESLDVQESICRKIAEDKGFDIFPDGKVFKESFSGRKDQRPLFDEILDLIKKNPGKVKYCMVRCIDRFTRGGAFSYETMKRELAKHGVELIDTYGIIQQTQNTLADLGFTYEWSKFSPSEISELIMASNAKSEVTTILTRLIGAEIRLTQQGYQIGPATDGYINKRIYVDGKKKMIQAPDPERAKYFIEMLTMRAANTHSDEEIVEHVNAMGFRAVVRNRWDKNHQEIIGHIGGEPLTVKRFRFLIQNPIYCGVICERWTKYQPIRAQYPGLVSIDTFNKANRGKIFIQDTDGVLQIFHDYDPIRTKAKLKDNPLFPYKFILCPLCHKPMMGSSPKGKSGKPFPTYHCSRRHKYFGVNKETLDKNFVDFVERLEFTSEFLESLKAIMLLRYRERQKELALDSSKISTNVSELEAKKAMELDAFVQTKNPSIRTAIEARIEDLENQIRNARTQRNKIEITEDDIQEYVAFVKEILEHPSKMLLNAGNSDNIHVQRARFGTVFEEIPDYQEIIAGTPKLSLVFQLSQPSQTPESLAVGGEGLEPPKA